VQTCRFAEGTSLRRKRLEDAFFLPNDKDIEDRGPDRRAIHIEAALDTHGVKNVD
jgi:hypothetical protein